MGAINMEGVERCSNKKKIKIDKFRLWMLLPVFIVIIIIFYLFSDEKTLKKSEISLIVIKEPETEQAKITTHTTVKTNKTMSNSKKMLKVLENLDEIQPYKRY